MRKIAVLDQHTIDKIAAGEVVERPSSIVKELVENAIDAGATAVTVEIADGGKKLIRITDNGGGMERDQVPLAFLRHATSKIQKAEDLEHISSLGFRGEALSSIAAVAQVELITKTPTAFSGVRYVINGGKEETLEDMGAPEGTTFLVRNLFYNVPARSKFLKSDTTEGNYISALMEQLALSHPEISFKYIQNKQVKLHTSGNYSVKDVIYNIYGRDITKALLDVSYENDFMKIEGFVGKPEISRGNRTFENYYINGRFVKNKIITKGIEDAYKGFLMQHKFPFVSLHIEMEGNDLDVNVHPTKMEVRFARGAEVYDAIFEVVRKALTRREMIPQVSVGRDEPKREVKQVVKSGDVPEPFEVRRREQMRQEQVRQESVRRENMPAAAGNSAVSAPKFDSALKFQGNKYENKPEMIQRPSIMVEKTMPVNAVPNTAAIPKQSYYQSGSSSTGAAIPLEAQMLREKAIYGTKEPLTKEEELFFDGTLKERIAKEAAQNPQTKVMPEAETSPTSTHEDSQTPNEQNAETSIAPAAENYVSQPMSQTSELAADAMSEQTADVHQETTVEQPHQLELFEEKLLSPESRIRHKLIGQIFDTYWLVQFGDNFYIIDQHAAHEKVYYERFVKQFQEQTIDSQYVSPPLIVTLNLQEEGLLKANRKYFEDFGFEIEHFGGKEYCISAVPSNLYGLNEEELFLEMLDHLAGDGEKDAMSIFAARLATMACKAAVKGNHQMSPQEADKLIDELLTLENPYHCPHGRPTIISMTKSELEKKFKRIV